jgi:myo-inositol-1(or 4)-monophosphatase
MRAAGEMARRAAARRADLPTEFKAGPLDPVTAADLEIEAFIRAELRRLNPGDGFWGEESGRPPDVVSGRCWICDPIDGTRSFLRFGYDYCLSLGLLVDGRIVFGIIYDPERDDLYEAALGGGALLNGAPARIQPISGLERALVGLGYSERVDAGVHAEFVGKVLRSGAMCHQHGSGALALAQIAAGRVDAYVELHQNAWDALAGLLIAAEAGALCLAWTADDLRLGGLTLAANPGIAAQLARFATGRTTHDWAGREQPAEAALTASAR